MDDGVSGMMNDELFYSLNQNVLQVSYRHAKDLQFSYPNNPVLTLFLVFTIYTSTTSNMSS